MLYICKIRKCSITKKQIHNIYSTRIKFKINLKNRFHYTITLPFFNLIDQFGSWTINRLIVKGRKISLWIFEVANFTLLTHLHRKLQLNYNLIINIVAPKKKEKCSYKCLISELLTHLYHDLINIITPKRKKKVHINIQSCNDFPANSTLLTHLNCRTCHF